MLTNDARSTGRIRGVPKIDDGATDGPPGRQLTTAWVELSVDEAYALLESLKLWAEEAEGGNRDPGWHTHITDADGRELTISVGTEDDGGASRA